MSNISVIHRHKETFLLRHLDEGDWFIYNEELYIKMKDANNYYIGGKKTVTLKGDIWVEKVDVDIYVKGRG